MGFRHLLVPTDGSRLSRKTIRLAVRLASSLGARLSAVYVIPEGVPTLFTGAKLYGSGVLSAQVRQAIRRAAGKALDVAQRDAAAAGVRCTGVHPLAPQPWRAIVDTARKRRCDLIVMGSHGRSGLPAVLLGSETTKVLAHSKVPVLVCR